MYKFSKKVFLSMIASHKNLLEDVLCKQRGRYQIKEIRNKHGRRQSNGEERCQNDSCVNVQRTSHPDYRKLGVCWRDFVRKIKSEEYLMGVKILREDIDNLRRIHGWISKKKKNRGGKKELCTEIKKAIIICSLA